MQLLDKTTISILLTGNTLVLRRTDGAEAPVYYAADGTAYMQHFQHGLLCGPWQVTEHGYAIEWNKGVGKMEWVLGYEPGEIIYLDKSETPRATMVRMLKGDAESLAA